MTILQFMKSLQLKFLAHVYEHNSGYTTTKSWRIFKPDFVAADYHWREARNRRESCFSPESGDLSLKVSWNVDQILAIEPELLHFGEVFCEQFTRS